MDDYEECLAFWHRNKSTLNKLVDPALSEPAASYAIERVFSKGGVLFYHMHVWQLTVSTYICEVRYIHCHSVLRLWVSGLYVQVSVFGTICSL